MRLSRIFLLPIAMVGLLPAQNLSLYSGNGQIVLQLFQSNAPLVVQATDASGRPQAGVPVTWSVTPNAGTLIQTSNVTDSNGLSSTGFVGTTNGQIGYSYLQPIVTAQSGNNSVSFWVTIAISNAQNGGLYAPPLVQLIAPTPGSTISGPAGSTIPGGVKVQVTAEGGLQGGQPVPHIGVRIPPNPDPTQPTAACNAPAGIALTGTDGTAICDLVLGQPTGTVALTALVGEIQNTAMFDLTVTPGVVCKYTLTPLTQGFTAAGGSGSVGIQTTAGCGWTVVSSQSWITVTSQTSGTGSFNVTYTVAANTGGARSGTLTIGGQAISISQVSASGPQPLTIVTSANLPEEIVGTPITVTLAASGGTPPYHWSSAGTLPPGQVLNSNTGVISGTPSTGGAYNFTITVTDSQNLSASQAFAITVLASGTGLVITNTGFASGVVGQAYTVQPLTSTLGCTTPFSPVPVFRVVNGSLPPGLSIQSTNNSFQIGGTPTTAGSYPFVLGVQDACGATATASFTIVVTATATPALNPTPATLTFTAGFGSTTNPPSQNISVGGTEAISYAASASTTTGGNWLSLTTGSGSVPGSLTVNVTNTSKLAPGTYSGTITLTSPSIQGSVTIPVSLTVAVPPTLTINPSKVALTLPTSGATLNQQSIVFSSGGVAVPFTASASTETGGAWLSVSPTSGNTPATLVVTMNSNGLTAGTYSGSIRIGTPYGNEIIAIALTVTPTALLVPSPPVLTFSRQQGAQPATQTLQITSSGGTTSVTATTSTVSGGPWLSVTPASATTPANLTVAVDPTGLSPGNYTGVVAVKSADTGIPVANVSVTLTVVVASTNPAVAAVTNAASFAPGPVAPGELLTLFGTQMGPSTLTTATLDNDGRISTSLAGTRVLFDGNPAPVIYTSAGQVAVVAPFSLASDATTMMQVEYQGYQSLALNLRVVDASPAIFTLDAKGQGAIVNQDGSINSAQHGAEPGSIVSVYATGAGQTNPLGVDGEITKATALSLPQLKVAMTINGESADVLYAGTAPGEAAGMLQVNVRVPSDAPHGSQVPVQLIVGSHTSPTVQMWVQ